MDTVKSLFCPQALLPTGWANRTRITIADGTITSVESDVDAIESDWMAAGPAMPGIPNVHSHAFQRAMAGLTERRTAGQDNFWSWRETMYQFVAALDADQVEAIATWLYVDLLRHGYTSVGEFHYLHHGPDGSLYSPASELAERHLAAARRAGMGITLMPVLYTYAGFDKSKLRGGQLRFFHETEGYLDLLKSLHAKCSGLENTRVGMAAHSLRAVQPQQILQVLQAMDGIDDAMPRHIHIAEQQAEVEICLAAHGVRPIQYFLRQLGDAVDDRWCLIHATHAAPDEVREMATADAVVGLCPTTEANLGDGFFPAVEYSSEGGVFSIGSDSHVSVSPWEELRTLEYGLRLQLQQRNCLAGDTESTGMTLVRHIMQGGRQALGRAIGRIEVGSRADLVVLQGQHPALTGRHGAALLDTMVVSGDATMVRDVFVGGRHVIKEGKHPESEPIAENYRSLITPLIERTRNR